MGYASNSLAFLRRKARASESKRLISTDTLAKPIVEAPAPPDGVTWLPTEDAVLLSIHLPKMKAAQRRVAIAFAIEEYISQPLEDVHVILGPEMSEGRWLVAIVSHQVMQSYAGNQSAPIRLLPDVLALPTPETGWAVWAGQSRILVRDADGTGFATTPAALPTFWSVANQPEITLYNGALPEGLPISNRAPLPDMMDKSLANFSLFTGRHSLRGERIPKGVIPLVSLAAFAIVGHLTLQILDVMALNSVATSREEALRSILKQPEGTNLDVALAQALSSRAPTEESGFLPLIAEAFQIIAPATGSVTLQNLRFNAADNVAIMTLEAPNLVTLQRLENDWISAGLRVSVGAATTGNGAAQVQVTLQQGRP